MPRTVKTEARAYRSPLRAEQAQVTQRRVLEAATALFLERGYARTTIAAVAAEAAVSPETIYGNLGSKRGLLEAVIDSTIDAYLAPVRDPFDESSPVAAIGRLPTARKRLRAWQEFATEVLSHTSPLHAVIRGAADSEPFAVELSDRLRRERLANITVVFRRYLDGALRPGLTIEEAAARALALQGPELHHLLTVQLAWTREQYCSWISELLERELLKPGRRAG